MTKSEHLVLWSAGLVLPGYPYRWLKPHLRPVARRLRDKGYIRRRNFYEGMRPTARGMAVLNKS